MKISVYLFIACTFLFQSKTLLAQDHSGYSQIGDLAQVDWAKSEVKDSIRMAEILERCLGGQDALRDAIRANPDSFPLHELENPKNFETDEHRRWEYQMKRMPVVPVAIKDIDQIINVEMTFEPGVAAVCKTTEIRASLSVSNISETSAPSFTIAFQPLPGLSLRDVKIVSKTNDDIRLQQTGRRDVKFNVSKLNPKDSFYVSLVFVVDCDGSGGSPSLSADTLSVYPEYLIDFIGYQLDYSERVLYKLIGKSSLNSELILTRDVKLKD